MTNEFDTYDVTYIIIEIVFHLQLIQIWPAKACNKIK